MPPISSDIEEINRYKKRMKLNDAEAFFMLGGAYARGELGLQEDMSKALELWNKAADLGSCMAHYSLGIMYNIADGVERDLDKAIHHWKLAAMGGHEMARQHLGTSEIQSGNIDRAIKHFMIAARSGEKDSLKIVGDGYKAKQVTKDEYASTLRAYQETNDGMKSKQRDKAHNAYQQGHFDVGR